MEIYTGKDGLYIDTGPRFHISEKTSCVTSWGLYSDWLAVWIVISHLNLTYGSSAMLPNARHIWAWWHFPPYWPFVRGIHWSPINSPHKGQWRGALVFSLICTWINRWLTVCEAGELRRHRAHYDATVMLDLGLIYVFFFFFFIFFFFILNIKKGTRPGFYKDTLTMPPGWRLGFSCFFMQLCSTILSAGEVTSQVNQAWSADYPVIS